VPPLLVHSITCRHFGRSPLPQTHPLFPPPRPARPSSVSGSRKRSLSCPGALRVSRERTSHRAPLSPGARLGPSAGTASPNPGAALALWLRRVSRCFDSSRVRCPASSHSGNARSRTGLVPAGPVSVSHQSVLVPDTTSSKLRNGRHRRSSAIHSPSSARLSCSPSTE
jgi:hypothetical protein